MTDARSKGQIRLATVVVRYYDEGSIDWCYSNKIIA
jgi:hypothetical protein